MDGTALVLLEGDPLIGSRFGDRYVIEKCIGEGAMGRVYLARHQRMSRKFAIKVLFGDHAAQPKMRERFSREAQASSILSHPNLISVLDYGEDTSGVLYLVMDYVPGRELSQVIAAEAPLAPERIRRLLGQLCEGLAHAHDRGFVHRDFKGANVLVTGTGDNEVARIVDFGIAIAPEASDQRLTTAGMVVGTPAYMSPEQATAQPLDHRSDLFSLGVVLYEMLAGVLPFDGSPMEQVNQNLTCHPPPIHERVPGLTVDGYLEHISCNLMAKSPEDRYQNARMVVAALDASPGRDALATKPVPASDQMDAAPRKPATRSGEVAARCSDRTASECEVKAGDTTSVAPTGDVLREAVDPFGATQPGQPGQRQPGRWRRRLVFTAVAGAIFGLAFVVLLTASRERSLAVATKDTVPAQASAAVVSEQAMPIEAPERESTSTSHDHSMEVARPERSAADQKPRPSVAKRARRAKPRPANRHERACDVPAKAEPDTFKPTEQSLKALHRKIGQALAKLEKAYPDAVSELSASYLDIQIHKAQRDPAMMREAFSQLRVLKNQIKRKLDEISH